jgi:hypothetical protein
VQRRRPPLGGRLRQCEIGSSVVQVGVVGSGGGAGGGVRCVCMSGVAVNYTRTYSAEHHADVRRQIFGTRQFFAFCHSLAPTLVPVCSLSLNQRPLQSACHFAVHSCCALVLSANRLLSVNHLAVQCDASQRDFTPAAKCLPLCSAFLLCSGPLGQSTPKC